jgi:ABC-type transporter Mla subunit MlaD
MLDRLDFLRFAKQHEQDVITLTRAAKAAAENAARRLAALEQHDRMITDAVATQARAIASMGDLLRARQAALQSARAARIAALHATHARTDQLRQALSRLQAQLANSSGQSFGSWTIPSAIVMCESGGQNLPPNGAGASGYYQFLPSTWRQLGGSTPAAYLAPKSEQDRLAGELWAGGQGASNWACSGIVGVR